MPSTTRREVVLAVAAALLALTGVAIAVARSDERATATAAPTVTAAAQPSPTPAAALVEPGTIGAVTTRARTAVRSAADAGAPVLRVLRPGILLPALARRGRFVAVLTPCEAHGWVAAADVQTYPRAAGSPRTLAEATIVIDPGHGGQLPGAVGPHGTPEKTPNEDIALRLADDLAPARVFITRTADYTAGLDFRAAIANALDAHLFISVHNNSDPDGPSRRPGTETYYQHASAASKRLAGLLYEEVVGAVTPYNAPWVADVDAGAKYRVNASGGDYYHVLRAVRSPAVIAENLFLSNAPEEALLDRADVRDSIAGGLARGVRRFVETTDTGSGFVTPIVRPPGPAGRLPPKCIEPSG